MGYKLQEINIEIDNNDKIQDFVWHKLNSINTESFNTNTLPIQSQIKVYTDGSKTQNHTGSGYSIIRSANIILEGIKKIPDKSRVFQVEIRAIKMAINDRKQPNS